MKTQKPITDKDEEIKISFLGFKVEAKNPQLKSFIILIIVLLFIILASNKCFSFN